MKKAFSLIELLVVIAIIAILAAILFPVFAQARESARMTQCMSNARQIGLAVVMYRTDSDGAMPIFYAYNTRSPDGQPALPGSPLHKGIEVQLKPYAKSAGLFKSPLDRGGDWQEQDVPGTRTYADAYGSSYRFVTCMYTQVPGESTQNNDPSSFTRLIVVNEGQIQFPSETRVVRLEVFPFFSRRMVADACDRYGWDCDPPYNYYREWGKRGGSMVFADGSARTITTARQFDDARVNPDGNKSGEPNSSSWSGTWYGPCD